MVDQNVLWTIIGVLVAIIGVLVAMAWRREDKSEIEADVDDIRNHLVNAAKTVWWDMTSVCGVNENMGLTGVSLKPMDLSAWHDFQEKYKSLVRATEYKIAKELFDTLDRLANGPLPGGTVRSKPGFLCDGDWVEGHYAFMLLHTDFATIVNGNLPEKIQDYIDFIGHDEVVERWDWPEHWTIHPHTTDWLIPADWKERYETRYYDASNQSDGKAKPLTAQKSRYAPG